MKYLFVLVIVLFIFLQSCTPKKTSLVTTELHRSDYTETIVASGAVQAVNTLNIMAPMNYYGILTVARVVPEGSLVEQGDTICILECTPMVQTLDEELRSLESLQADLKKLEADNALNRALLDARMKENQAGMAINQLDSVQMRFAPPVRKQLLALELEKSRVQERKLQKKDAAERKIDETEIRQLNSRIIQSENKVKSIQEQVAGLTILAPKSGIVTKSEMQGMIMMMSMDGNTIDLGGYPKVGGNIYPEMALMALPELEEMQVALEVQEVDYKRVDKGQKVEIIVDAAGDLHTTGTVKRKSLAAKMRYSGQSKVKWYQVIVSVDSLHERMPPGLSVRCNILISQVADTVVIPTMAIFERDSMKVVYVAAGDKFRAVPVETGLSNSSQTIISKGLTGTEKISLMEPPQNFIEKPNNPTHE